MENHARRDRVKSSQRATGLYIAAYSMLLEVEDAFARESV